MPEDLRVIIIGGGMAGLGLAHRLTQTGTKVLVLEAQLRVGGRVHTLRRGLSDGLYAEAGAEFLPQSHALTMALVREFNLPLVNLTAQENGSALYYVRGRRIVIKGSAMGREFPYALTAQERKLGLAGMTKAYCDPGVGSLGNPLDPDWPPKELAPLGALTLCDYMHSKGASQAAIDLLSLGANQFWGDGPSTYSALGLLREKYIDTKLGVAHGIQGGNDQLPRAVAASLGDKVRTGAKVVRIERRANRVTVKYEKDGQRHQVTGSHAVCALPFPVLREIEIDPPFSDSKTHVIRSLRASSVTRIYLQMKTQFWRKQGLSGYATTNLPAGVVMTMSRPPGGPEILQCYASGLAARDLGALSESERVQAALSQVSQFFPEARRNFVRGVSKVWDDDPYERGAYAWFAPGEMLEFIQPIMRPEGRVYFAGDHTSPRLGWIQGALESAERVMQEILSGGAPGTGWDAIGRYSETKECK